MARKQKINTQTKLGLALALVVGLFFWRKAKISHFQDWASSISRPNLASPTQSGIYYWFEVLNGKRIPNASDVANNTGGYKQLIPKWNEYKKRKYLI